MNIFLAGIGFALLTQGLVAVATHSVLLGVAAYFALASIYFLIRAALQ